MNKDVIYIDVDDDVTAIIGKIKTAKEKIVALVPPKRAGVLQSAVNLRLLERMARTELKQLVLVTNNQALVALAASARIPVAKNLQSKPEIAEIPAIIVDNDDDIIDGSELPVGEHAKTVKARDSTKPVATHTRSDAIDDTDLTLDSDDRETPEIISKESVKKSSKRPKIPNFDSFRKKLFIAIGGGVALIALLIWMFVFAPAATIVITARTSPQPINATVSLGGTAATNVKTSVISSLTKQTKKDVTVEFVATGEKDVGEKATGTLSISKLSEQPYGVPIGTRFTTNGGKVFITQTAVTIPAYSVCFPSLCAGSVDVDVTAEQPGTSYNGITGSVSGPASITGTFQGATNGGTTKIAKVVSASDVERAKGELVGLSQDTEKQALKKQFTQGEIIVDGSFIAKQAEPVASPAIDSEAPDGKARLTALTTFSMVAVPQIELETYIKDWLVAKIDDKTQKIYNTGADKATIGDFQIKENDAKGTLATINTTASVGPRIDEEAIKNQVKGKRYGEIQQSLEAQDGIQSVDVAFSYFWVRTVPNNIDKIKVEFNVEND